MKLGLLFLLGCVESLAAQAGDVAGEKQPALPEHLVLPPSPPLSPEEEAATFRLPRGFTIELVAAEPLVRDPVQAVFDDKGRLWVVEMRGYMPDIEGNGEHEPVGAVVTLSDTNGDGRMDERVVFLDQLVLPRSVQPYRNGVLVIAPPELLFCRDTDGDGRADEREVIDTGLSGLANPEHAVNGLLPTLDGWIRCANWERRYRYRGGRWEMQPTAWGGQWGVTIDAFGRIFFNNNSQALRYDRVPSHYVARNPHFGSAPGANQELVAGARTFPAHPTPGVNRGYQEGILRADGRLARLTAACAPHVYRGPSLGEGFDGNAFVCEPSANLIQRYQLRERGDGGLEAEHVHGKLDFLTSTDERFRPVDLCDGPDGGLYVVDLYRGLVQHRIFLTSFLRGQIEDRGLAAPIGLGRIWRVRRNDASPRPWPDVDELSWTELVAWLADEDGFRRDVAQRAILAEGVDDEFVQGLLRDLLGESTRTYTKLHALHCLEATGGLTTSVVAQAVTDPSIEVRIAAVRVAEGLIDRAPELRQRLVETGRKEGGRLRRQVLFSLGEIGSQQGEPALLSLLADDASQADDRAAAISGLRGRELEVLTRLVSDATRDGWKSERDGRAALIEILARCIVREGQSERIELLLGLVSAHADEGRGWQRAAIEAGILAARSAGAEGPRPIALAHKPRADNSLPPTLLAAFIWPGHPDAPYVKPLDREESLRFQRGRELFASVCAACHGSSGWGDPGKAPPLRESPWVQGDVTRLVRILDQGLIGPIERAGKSYDFEMPGWVASDEHLASVLTFLRREWGHIAEPVSPDEVSALRSRLPARTRPWKESELDSPREERGPIDERDE